MVFSLNRSTHHPWLIIAFSIACIKLFGKPLQVQDFFLPCETGNCMSGNMDAHITFVENNLHTVSRLEQIQILHPARQTTHYWILVHVV
jgi:hypothetical protein